MAPHRTPGIDALIERQAVRWNMARHIAQPAAEHMGPPCVAISRLPFSAGNGVAERVAAALDYGLFGRDVVERIAGHDSAAASLLNGLDESRRSTVERFVVEIFRSHVQTQDEQVSRVVRVIATLGRRGAAVILGRGAAHVLTADRALRVLVVGTKDDRVARIAADRRLDLPHARVALTQEEAARANFVHRHFGVDYKDPTLYDVTVNTSTLGIEGSAHVVLDAFHRRFPEVGRAS